MQAIKIGLPQCDQDKIEIIWGKVAPGRIRWICSWGGNFQTSTAATLIDLLNLLGDSAKLNSNNIIDEATI